MPRKPVRKSRPTNTSVGHSLELRNRDTNRLTVRRQNIIGYLACGIQKTASIRSKYETG
jgi:hypothetical protein